MLSMEIFRTIVPTPVSDKKISYGTQLMLLGSCFSEHIGNKLAESKFLTDNNPFGIVYNPLSAVRQLEIILRANEYGKDDLFQNEGLWCSFDHHSRFAGTDRESSLKVINEKLFKSHVNLKSTQILFLTFGTSYVYFLRSTGQVVSNCHKVPSKEFERRIISVNDIILAFETLMPKLTHYNPNLHIVFTVSPIRHWKDGAHENQISKSILLLAVEEIKKIYPNTSYFPSYEIMMDDLRDYRFYAEDMLHLNLSAVNYIWERFKECFLTQDTFSLMKEIEKVIQAVKHRPFNPQSEAFLVFARQQYQKIKYLQDQYKISLEPEEEYFKSLLPD
jgi:hypothetical protein